MFNPNTLIVLGFFYYLLLRIALGTIWIRWRKENMLGNGYEYSKLRGESATIVSEN
jgi:hypothetical protein